MEYIILNDENKKYYIDTAEKWKEILKKTDSYGIFDFEKRKNDRYEFAGNFFSVNDIKKLEITDTGSYIQLYMRHPEPVLKNGNSEELVDEIIRCIYDRTALKWNFTDLFLNIDSPEAKLKYLEIIEGTDIAEVPDEIYDKLADIAFYAKYRSIKIINDIFSDDRFKMPENPDMDRLSEADADKKVHYLNNVRQIKEIFEKCGDTMDKFLSSHNIYTKSVAAALTDINPALYITEPEIGKIKFTQLVKNNMTGNQSEPAMKAGYLHRERAVDAVIRELGCLTDEIIQAGFEDIIPDSRKLEKCHTGFMELCGRIAAGIMNVPDIFSDSECRKIPALLQSIIKCPGFRSEAAEYLNKIISAYNCGIYDRMELSDIFSGWVEGYSTEFKRCVKYISEDNIEFMSRYLSEKEIKVLHECM